MNLKKNQYLSYVTSYKLINLMTIFSLFLFFLINNFLFSNEHQPNFNSYIIKFKTNNLNEILKNKIKSDLEFEIENKIRKNSNIKTEKISIVLNSLNILNQLENTNNKNNSILKSQNSNSTALFKELSKYHILFTNLNIIENNNVLSLDFLNEIINKNQLLSDNIDFITPNYIYKIEKNEISNDPFSKDQWALNHFRINKVWEKATGKDIKIGVVDTGIDWEHNDLINQLWYNEREDINRNGRFDAWSINEKRDGISGDIDGIDNDKNGFIDDVLGYDFVNQNTFNPGDFLNPDPFPFDENGHGTNVSSVMIAEKDNKLGIAGMSYNSKVITARAFDALGSGESDDIASAIVYCALNGAKVINLSFGERFRSPIIESAIKYAHSLGCVLVSSSGNNNWWFPHYPSDFQEVISVGAFNQNLVRETSISNYGSFVDIMAPGHRINVAETGNQFSRANGTSLSAPHVASVVAMMFELKPDLTPNEVLTILKSNATDIGPEGWDFENSAGLLNPLKTLENLAKSDVRFLTNSNELYIDRTLSKNIELKANILEPLFENYIVQIAAGLYPKPNDFSTLVSGNNQIKNQVLLNLDLSKLKDTLYTIALIVNKKNKTQVQSRIKLYVNSVFSKLNFTKTNITEALKDDKRVLQFDMYANRECFLDIYYKPTIESNFKKINNYEKYTRNHNLMVEKIFEPNIEYDIEAHIYSNNLPELNSSNNYQIFKTKYKIANNSAYSLDWDMKNYSLPPSFINPIVFDDFNGDNINQYLITNRLENGTQFGKLYLYQFNGNPENNNGFTLLDSLNDLFINLSIGKINNQRVILTNSNFKARVYQIIDKNGKLAFNQTPIYATNQQSSEWGATLYDFDNDGSDEVLCFNDTTFAMYKYGNNVFKILTMTPTITYEIPTQNGTRLQKRYLSTNPAFTIGKFTSNDYELIYDIGGFIVVCKFKDNKFELIRNYSYLVNNGKNLRHLSIINNFDTDKKSNALAITTTGDADFEQLVQVQNNLWNFEILEENIDFNNQYILNKVWEDNIFGVKDGFVRSFGFSYKNSLNIIDIDNMNNTKTDDTLDDIVLCLTPNLYIYRNVNRNNLTNLKKSVAWTSGVFSNAIIYNDFDKNNKREIGVNFFGGTRFLELKNEIENNPNSSNNSPKAVSGFSGNPLNDNSAILNWDIFDKDNQNIRYEIFEITDFTKGELTKIIETISNTNTLRLENLKSNRFYYLTIRAINVSDPQNIKYGSFTLPYYLEIYPHSNIYSTGIQVLDSMNINLSFNGKLPLNSVNTGYFNITNEKSESYRVNSAIVINDTLLSLNLSDKLINGEYKITIDSFSDYFRTPTLSNELYFSYNQKSQNDFYSKNYTLNANRIKIYYSENIVKSNISLDNFELSPIGEILSIDDTQFDTDTNSVTLILSDNIFRNAIGNIYTIKSKNLTSLSGAKITTNAGAYVSFVIRQNNLNDPFVLPNPANRNTHDFVTFSNLTQNAKIEIFNTYGNKIAEINENDGDGGANWDFIDQTNQKVGAGVYLYKVTGYNDQNEYFETELLKFMIKE